MVPVREARGSNPPGGTIRLVINYINSSLMAIANKRKYDNYMKEESNALSDNGERSRTKVEGQKYKLYILKINIYRLYIGITDNVERRISEHKQSKGAKFTKHSESIELVYTEECDSLQTAMKREKQIKGWTRAKKEALIAGDLDRLKRL